LHFGDVANGLLKSVVFGLVIALSSCHFGLSTPAARRRRAQRQRDRRGERRGRVRPRLHHQLRNG